MDDSLLLHRIHFAFTIMYHYLFPQLTIGLALIMTVFKTLALRTGDPVYHESARFWIRVFGINFVFGVVTGIPMEFQFGTNWARFSSAAGGVIGQTLAMEGMFAFFLESAFLGLLIYGEDKVSEFFHWLCTVLVSLGSWMSAWFIVATNAWMQHPVGYTLTEDGEIVLNDILALFTNPWLFWQFPHVILGCITTGAFVVAAIGAFYTLRGTHERHARIFLKTAVAVGGCSTVLLAVPTGDGQAKLLYRHQPITFAAMEGHFYTEKGAPIILIGQPDVAARKIDNPVKVPGMLSFLTHQRWDAEIKGLVEFPEDEWPDNIPLLYYSYHIMAGLGTIMIGVMGVGAFLWWRGTMFTARWWLWSVMLCFPFPYIANTAGWMTAELGRQPWLIYGLMRTSDGHSENVSAGNVLFSLMGFMGMYALLSVIFVFLMTHEVERGPVGKPESKGSDEKRSIAPDESDPE